MKKAHGTADYPGMKLPGVFLFALLLAGRAAVAQAPVVTETKKVEFREETEKQAVRKIVLHKINGRWWSEDDREATPPPDGKGFWTMASEPGVVQFFHHRPFDVTRVASLHLFMRPSEVGAALGEPNGVVGKDPHAVWSYYTAEGIKLTVRFLDDGVLGEANFEAISTMSWPVASIERELNGRSIDEALKERADQKVLETYRSNGFAVRRSE